MKKLSNDDMFKVMFKTETQANDIIKKYNHIFSRDYARGDSCFIIFTNNRIYCVSIDSFFGSGAKQITPDQVEDEINMEIVLNGMQDKPKEILYGSSRGSGKS